MTDRVSFQGRKPLSCVVANRPPPGLVIPALACSGYLLSTGPAVSRIVPDRSGAMGADAGGRMFVDDSRIATQVAGSEIHGGTTTGADPDDPARGFAGGFSTLFTLASGGRIGRGRFVQG